MIIKAPSFGKAHHFRKCDIVPAPALIGKRTVRWHGNCLSTISNSSGLTTGMLINIHDSALFLEVYLVEH